MIKKSMLENGRVVKTEGESVWDKIKVRWDADMAVGDIAKELRDEGMNVSYNMVYNYLVRKGEIKRNEK